VQPRRHREPFDPAPWARELGAIIGDVAAAERLDARSLDRIVKRHPKGGSGLFSKSDIIAGFRRFGPGDSGLSEAEFVARLRLRPVRTLSGVTPVTVLTKPFPCPGTCTFCPSDVRMPKSYLADEPGAQRAEDNRFDPYLQTWNRLAAYRAMGHPVDKVELIVLGGTWSFYPERYQTWFATRCLEALCDFGADVDRRCAAGAAPSRYRALSEKPGPVSGPGYNARVRRMLGAQLEGGLLHESERADAASLREAQRRNEAAACRCVGLAVETRPDHVTEAECLRLRRLGVTKVQLGIQSLSDSVLAASRRGHDVAASRRAVALLRAAGFKIHAHWMANLPGATPDEDVADFARLFSDPDFRPDELKLYPCLLVESAELANDHARGDWRPYTDPELLDVLTACLHRTPRWCRLTRVIRDFSSHDIVAGTHTANLREVAERRLAERGGVCRDVRSREIRGRGFVREELRLLGTEYRTSVGSEVFLEYVTQAGHLVAFLRLSLPSAPSFVEEIAGSALIREVHVYGASLPLGARVAGGAQHAGLGGALLDDAARRAVEAGFSELAVISAVGTRAWYRDHGFRDGAMYQHLSLLPRHPAANVDPADAPRSPGAPDAADPPRR
jgi:elongator complex protein 3